jgi:hypothetical protein
MERRCSASGQDVEGSTWSAADRARRVQRCANSSTSGRHRNLYDLFRCRQAARGYRKIAGQFLAAEALWTPWKSKAAVRRSVHGQLDCRAAGTRPQKLHARLRKSMRSSWRPRRAIFKDIKTVWNATAPAA